MPYGKSWSKMWIVKGESKMWVTIPVHVTSIENHLIVVPMFNSPFFFLHCLLLTAHLCIISDSHSCQKKCRQVKNKCFFVQSSWSKKTIVNSKFYSVLQCIVMSTLTCMNVCCVNIPVICSICMGCLIIPAHQYLKLLLQHRLQNMLAYCHAFREANTHFGVLELLHLQRKFPIVWI